MSFVLSFLPQTTLRDGTARPTPALRCNRTPYASTLLERPVPYRQRVRSLISVEHWLGSTEAFDRPFSTPLDQQLELSILVDILPSRIKQLLESHPDLQQLVEVVLDLGRPVLARFADKDELLSPTVLSRAELQEVTSKVTEFGGDNRAGIDRCLHRISCIRNRDGQIVGLTCRVGRAIAGSANLVADVVLSGKSILLLGRPGVGKTTAIRDISRMLAVLAQKRVVIIDTSNEIAGDGNVPHPGIASARRMQVPVPEQQHRVMIEAVENHMPEVIVIDEIGSEAEALAAATIAQRGVQLVATAHGDQLQNILNNPTLQGLLGGVESVILGDDTAKKRGVQKSVRERAGPPTFDCCIEMEDRQRWRLYEDVAAACDGLLAGKEVHPMMRYKDEAGTAFAQADSSSDSATSSRSGRPAFSYIQPDADHDSSWPASTSAAFDSDSDSDSAEEATPLQRLQSLAGSWRQQQTRQRRSVARGGVAQTSEAHAGDEAQQAADRAAEPQAAPMQVYVHGIEESKLEAALTKSNLWHRIQVRDSLRDCDAAIGLRGKIKAGGWLRNAAKGFEVPIFSVKTSSPEHLTNAVKTILGLEPSSGGLFGAARGNVSRSAEDSQPVSRDEPPKTHALASDLVRLAQNQPQGAARPAPAQSSIPAPKPLGYDDAMDEAITAIEQIVLPRNQPIELLPRTEQVLDMQMEIVKRYDLPCEVVGANRKTRLRISPSWS